MGLERCQQSQKHRVPAPIPRGLQPPTCNSRSREVLRDPTPLSTLSFLCMNQPKKLAWHDIFSKLEPLHKKTIVVLENNIREGAFSTLRGSVFRPVVGSFSPGLVPGASTPYCVPGHPSQESCWTWCKLSTCSPRLLGQTVWLFRKSVHPAQPGSYPLGCVLQERGR